MVIQPERGDRRHLRFGLRRDQIGLSQHCVRDTDTRDREGEIVGPIAGHRNAVYDDSVATAQINGSCPTAFFNRIAHNIRFRRVNRRIGTKNDRSKSKGGVFIFYRRAKFVRIFIAIKSFICLGDSWCAKTLLTDS